MSRRLLLDPEGPRHSHSTAGLVTGDTGHPTDQIDKRGLVKDSKLCPRALVLPLNALLIMQKATRREDDNETRKSMMPLVKDDAPYADTTPDLFGSELSKQSKELLEQVKMI